MAAIPSLDAIAKKIRSHRAVAIEDAELILLARETYFNGSCQPWLKWAREECWIGKRQAEKYQKVARWLRSIDIGEFSETHPGALDLSHLEILSDIPPQKLAYFLARNALAELDRDELRAAVAAFLGVVKPIKAVLYGKMPGPQEILEAARQPKMLARMKESKEFGYMKGWVERGLLFVKYGKKERGFNTYEAALHLQAICTDMVDCAAKRLHRRD